MAGGRPRHRSLAFELGARRITPSDEARHQEFPVGLTKAQRRALRVARNPAGSGQDGAAGRDIPFADWRQSRIEICVALRELAELDRGAASVTRGERQSREEFLGTGVEMAA